VISFHLKFFLGLFLKMSKRSISDLYEDKQSKITGRKSDDKRPKIVSSSSDQDFPLLERIQTFLKKEKEYLEARTSLLNLTHRDENSLNLTFQALKQEKSPSLVPLITEGIQMAKQFKKLNLVLANEVVKKKKDKAEKTPLQKTLGKLKEKQAVERKRFRKDRVRYDKMSHEESLETLLEKQQRDREELKISNDVQGFLSEIVFYQPKK